MRLPLRCWASAQALTWVGRAARARDFAHPCTTCAVEVGCSGTGKTRASVATPNPAARCCAPLADCRLSQLQRSACRQNAPDAGRGPAAARKMISQSTISVWAAAPQLLHRRCSRPGLPHASRRAWEPYCSTSRCLRSGAAELPSADRPRAARAEAGGAQLPHAHVQGGRAAKAGACRTAARGARAHPV